MVTVAIYGGGIGGLSAAHELIKRGFAVDVYEARQALGGKALSQFIPHTGTAGRSDLPGEHGFRFFPAFYLHLDDTMRDIPTADGRSVFDALEGSSEFAVARNGGYLARASRRIAPDLSSLPSIWEGLSMWFDRDGLRMNLGDMANLSGALLRMWTACDERRQGQYENQSWFDFANAGKCSIEYQRLTSALPRTMVAMDGRHGSAYTIGKVASQLFMFDMGRSDVDRVLNGPTTSRWLAPWEAHLRKLGVRFHMDSPLQGFNVRDGRIHSANVRGWGQVSADYHVCAIPIEVMRRSIIDDELGDAAPSLAAVRHQMKDSVDWMVGAQFYLDQDIDLCNGHVIYTDSPWALSSISQPQYWRLGDQRPFHEVYGDGRTKGLISVDISDWSSVAPRTGRTARKCTREEVTEEVFYQLIEAINQRDAPQLTARNLVHAHLDTNIQYDERSKACRNKTPLLVHRPGHWRYRPDAHTAIDNLFLASDYVRTHTNLATMEGANEAARRAVRGIIAASGMSVPEPHIFPMTEPRVLQPLKDLDRWWLNVTDAADESHIFDLNDDARLAALRRARDEAGIDMPKLRESLRGDTRRSTQKGETEVCAEIEGMVATLAQLD